MAVSLPVEMAMQHREVPIPTIHQCPHHSLSMFLAAFRTLRPVSQQWLQRTWEFDDLAILTTLRSNYKVNRPSNHPVNFSSLDLSSFFIYTWKYKFYVLKHPMKGKPMIAPVIMPLTLPWHWQSTGTSLQIYLYSRWVGWISLGSSKPWGRNSAPSSLQNHLFPTACCFLLWSSGCQGNAVNIFYTEIT